MHCGNNCVCLIEQKTKIMNHICIVYIWMREYMWFANPHSQGRKSEIHFDRFAKERCIHFSHSFPCFNSPLSSPPAPIAYASTRLSLNPSSFLLHPSVNNTTDRVDTEVTTPQQSKMISFTIDLILVLESFQKSTKLVYQRNNNRKLPSSMKRKQKYVFFLTNNTNLYPCIIFISSWTKVHIVRKA